jgi:hypothetical protein
MGWLADGAVLMRTARRQSNSLIYRENTGKFIDFGPDSTSYPSETAAAIYAFSLNSLRSGTGNYF